MLKAARVASITAGRIYLVQHEAKSLKGPGGHTIAKHVGKTEAQLRARLMQGPRLTAASSFTDLRTAEFAISEALRAHSGQIKTWAAGYGAAKLRFDAATIKPVGKVVLRTTGRLEDARKVRVVLLREQYNGMPYFVLTAFPIS
jgi:hypothetical protein